MQDPSLHSHFKTPGFTHHDGAVGVPEATTGSAQRSAQPQAAALRAEAHTLLAHLQHTDEFACELPTIGPAAPYLAAARQWLATVALLPAPTRSLLRPEQSLLSRLTQ
ncbi:MAG: hypothetical protein ACI4AM_09605 [Muribaculaceae bacterium]